MNVRTQFRCQLLVLGLAAGMLMPGRASAQVKLEFVNGEAKTAGVVAKTDPADPVRKQPAKKFTIDLKEGESYQIDMKSFGKLRPIDPYLRLEDADGKELASDDDGGDGLDARINFKAPAAGKYTIVATTFGGGTGGFFLTVKNLDAKPAKLDAAKLELKDGQATVESNVAANDAPDPVSKKPCKMFAVELKAGETYQIDMMRDATQAIDPYLRLLNPAGQQVAFNDDGGEGLNAKLNFQPPATGVYTIVATTFGGGAGPFTLVVKNAGKVVAGKKDTLTLNNGFAQVKAKLANTDPLDKLQDGCRCKIYTIALKANTRYQIDMMSKQVDSFLRIENAQGQNLEEDDDGGDDLDAQLTFNCPADGTFRIIATTFAPSTGDFNLIVRELPK